MEPPAEFVTAVMGRYAGVVDVLAGILRDAGVDVATTWAADTDPPAARPPAVDCTAVVVTVGPGDPTLHQLREDGVQATVIAVVWHPDDEIGHIPTPHRIVRAGQIRATLVRVVREVRSG